MMNTIFLLYVAFISDTFSLVMQRQLKYKSDTESLNGCFFGAPIKKKTKIFMVISKKNNLKN